MVTGVETTTDANGAGALTTSSTANIGGATPVFDTSGVSDYAFALGFPADPTALSPLIATTLADNAAIDAQLGGANAMFFGYGTQGATASTDAGGKLTLASTEQFTLNGAGADGELILGLVGNTALGAGFTSLSFTASVGGAQVENQVFDTLASAQAFFSDNALDLGAIPATDGLIVSLGLTLVTSTAGNGFAASFLLGATSVTGVTWSGAIGTDLGTAGNWRPAVVPDATEPLTFNLAAGGILTGAVGGMNAAFTGAGGWVLQDAALILAGGGTAPALADAGDLTVSGGSISAGGSIALQAASGATMTILGGALVSAEGGAVGADAGESGSLVLAGAGTALQDTGTGGSLLIGGGGSGLVTVAAGASVTDAGVDILGGAASGTGELAVSAGGNFATAGLIVGDAGLGSLAITSGGTVSAASLDSGVLSGSDANILVTGAASTGAGSVLSIAGQLTVGDGSSADLSIGGGATVAAGNADIGLDAGTGAPALPGGAGVVDIEGVGSELSIAGNLNIGDAGTGALLMGVGTTLHVADALDIGASGALQQFGGTIDPSSLTNNSANAAGGSGAVLEVSTLLTNDGMYTAGAGGYTIDVGTAEVVGGITTYVGGALDGTGTLVVGTNGFSGELVLNAGTVAATQTVEFDDRSTSEVLTIGTLDGFAAVIGSFGPTAEIIVAGVSIASDAYSNGVLTLFGAGVGAGVGAAGAELGTLTIGPGVDPSLLTVNAEGGVGEAPCFASGTRIATARGEVAVEAISVGDQVRVVMGGGLAEVIWVGRREVDCTRHPQPRKVWPVRVSAGAFGPGRPHTDLLLSPDHAVYVGDVLIPIRHLINGSSIVQQRMARVTYHHLELAAHDVLLAEGLPAESFLDMRDGTNYANRPGSVRLYPDFSVRMWEAFGCAPLVVTGPELNAARLLVAGFTIEQQAA